MGTKHCSKCGNDLALREPVPVPTGWGEDWEGDVPRTVTGVPRRTSRLKALGNGQVPQAAAAAWLMLTQKKPPHERATGGLVRAEELRPDHDSSA